MRTLTQTLLVSLAINTPALVLIILSSGTVFSYLCLSSWVVFCTLVLSKRDKHLITLSVREVKKRLSPYKKGKIATSEENFYSLVELTHSYSKMDNIEKIDPSDRNIASVLNILLLALSKGKENEVAHLLIQNLDKIDKSLYNKTREDVAKKQKDNGCNKLGDIEIKVEKDDEREGSIGEIII